MRTLWMVLVVGCVSEPDWVASCASDCAKGQLCTVAADERCVAPPAECADAVDGCGGGPSDACVEVVCGQAATYSFECWDDDEDIARYVLFCDASGI